MLDMRVAEIYDINKNVWTDRDEFYLPLAVGRTELIFHGGRLIMMGGGHDTSSGKLDSVWEWNKKDGWKEKSRRLVSPANTWEGNIMPFIRKYSKPEY